MVLCYLKSFITDVFSTKKIKIIHRIPLLILNLLNNHPHLNNHFTPRKIWIYHYFNLFLYRN